MRGIVWIARLDSYASRGLKVPASYLKIGPAEDLSMRVLKIKQQFLVSFNHTQDRNLRVSFGIFTIHKTGIQGKALLF